MSSSATPSGKSSRSAAPPRSRNHTCCWNPAGSAMRVYQNPDPSSRQAIEPPMRWTWGMGSPTTSPLATSKMCNVPSSVPCSDSETARRFPSGGRDEPVDRGLARRVDGFRIDDDALSPGVVQVGEGHQERPLPGRLLLQREVGAPARGQARVRRPFGPEQLLDPRPQRTAPRQRLEVRAGQLLLRLCPGDGFRRRRVLQPLVVLGDVDPVVPGGDRDPWRLHGGKRCHPASQQLCHATAQRARLGVDRVEVGLFSFRCQRRIAQVRISGVRGSMLRLCIWVPLGRRSHSHGVKTVTTTG